MHVVVEYLLLFLSIWETNEILESNGEGWKQGMIMLVVQYGQVWVIDFSVIFDNASGAVKSSWVIHFAIIFYYLPFL